MRSFLYVLFLGATLNPLAWGQDVVSLQNAIDLIETKPADAEKALTALPQPTAKAFRAYIRFVEHGPSDVVDELMNKAISEVTYADTLGDIDPTQHYHYATVQDVLNHLRFIAGSEPPSEVTIPCGIFQRHPLEVYRAFDSYGGYNADNLPYLCKVEALSKTAELIRYTDKYRMFNPETQGTSVKSKRRHQDLYLLKAYYTPEYSLEDVGLETDATTLAQARKAMPKARWLNGVETRLNTAITELVAVLRKTHEGVPLKTLRENTREALEAYVSYQLIRGDVANH